MATDLTKLTDQALLALQREAVCHTDFIRSDYYTNKLRPELEIQGRIATANALWKPGKTPDPNELSLYNSYNSGYMDGLRAIESIVRQHVVEAERIVIEIERRKKKNAV